MLLLLACGKNVYVDQEKKDPATEASRELEKDNPKAAINVLLDALGSEYKATIKGITVSTDLTETENTLTVLLANALAKGKKNAVQWVSVLASAQAQLYNVDPFVIALKLATKDKSTKLVDGATPDSQTLTILFPLLPESTPENIRGLDTAITMINSLGDSMTVVDTLKKAIFLTSAVSLSLKKLDVNGDGTIAPEELLTMDQATAIAVISQIASAASTSSTGAAGSDPAAAAIQSIQTQIQAQEGTTDEEKLKNFIASKKK